MCFVTKMSLKLCKAALQTLSRQGSTAKRGQAALPSCSANLIRHHNVRHRCTSAIPSPPAEGQPKIYSEKIQNIVEQISQLSLIEVADLNEHLKNTLRITEAAPMMMSGMAPAAAPVEEEEEVQSKYVQTEFTVNFLKFEEAKKVAVIKAIKSLSEGMNLVQAKKFVDSAPQTLKANISKEEAEKIKKELEAVGGTVEIE